MSVEFEVADADAVSVAVAELQEQGASLDSGWARVRQWAVEPVP
jgi:hypothetical protein